MFRAMVADCAEMFVDAKHNQYEFGGNAREDDADDDAGDRGQELKKPAEWADCHRGKAGKDATEAEQPD
jgi:hypothetical protein